MLFQLSCVVFFVIYVVCRSLSVQMHPKRSMLLGNCPCAILAARFTIPLPPNMPYQTIAWLNITLQQHQRIRLYPSVRYPGLDLAAVCIWQGCSGQIRCAPKEAICPTMPHNLPYYALNSALLCPILCPTMSHTSYFALLFPNNQHTSQAGRATRDVASSLALAIWTSCLSCTIELFDGYHIC